jgi:hypothetical protein
MVNHIGSLGICASWLERAFQARVNAACMSPFPLPKASAQPAAERRKETADPSTRAEALARDDKKMGTANAALKRRST